MDGRGGGRKEGRDGEGMEQILNGILEMKDGQGFVGCWERVEKKSRGEEKDLTRLSTWGRRRGKRGDRTKKGKGEERGGEGRERRNGR